MILGPFILSVYSIKFRCQNDLSIIQPKGDTVWAPNTNVTIEWKGTHNTNLPLHVLLLKLPDNQTDTPFNRLLPTASQYLADPVFVKEHSVNVTLDNNLEPNSRYYVRILYTNLTDKDVYYSCSPLFQMTAHASPPYWKLLALSMLLINFV